MNGDSNPFESPEAPPEPAYDPALDAETKNWAVVLHLMQYGNWFLPPAGFILVILIWMFKKDELPGLDAHGRVVTNWMISSFLYAVAAGLLCLVLVGIPLAILLGVLVIVYPIIGAVKASQGEVWKYPLSIRFL